jgi:hypothetical protein
VRQRHREKVIDEGYCITDEDRRFFLSGRLDAESVTGLDVGDVAIETDGSGVDPDVTDPTTEKLLIGAPLKARPRTLEEVSILHPRNTLTC